MAVPSRHNRGHHSVPARDVRRFQKVWSCANLKDVLVSYYAVDWFGEIRMAIKSRVEKRNRHPSSPKPFINIQPERCRQNVFGLSKDSRVGVKLGLSSTKQLDAMRASMDHLSAGYRVGPHNSLQVGM